MAARNPGSSPPPPKASTGNQGLPTDPPRTVFNPRVINGVPPKKGSKTSFFLKRPPLGFRGKFTGGGVFPKKNPFGVLKKPVKNPPKKGPPKTFTPGPRVTPPFFRVKKKGYPPPRGVPPRKKKKKKTGGVPPGVNPPPP